MDAKQAEDLATQLLQAVGPSEALLLSMRLILLVGQGSATDPKVVNSAKEAVTAIKRIGILTGNFAIPS